MTMTTDRRAVADAFRRVERDLTAAGIAPVCAGRDDSSTPGPALHYRRNWSTDDRRDPAWSADRASFGWDRGAMGEAEFLVTVCRVFRRHGFTVTVPMSEREAIVTAGWDGAAADAAARYEVAAA